MPNFAQIAREHGFDPQSPQEVERAAFDRALAALDQKRPVAMRVIAEAGEIQSASPRRAAELAAAERGVPLAIGEAKNGALSLIEAGADFAGLSPAMAADRACALTERVLAESQTAAGVVLVVKDVERAPKALQERLVELLSQTSALKNVCVIATSDARAAFGSQCPLPQSLRARLPSVYLDASLAPKAAPRRAAVAPVAQGAPAAKEGAREQAAQATAPKRRAPRAA
jgi:hypothetical protein